MQVQDKKIFFTYLNRENQNHAGSKANQDVLEILQKEATIVGVNIYRSKFLRMIEKIKKLTYIILSSKRVKMCIFQENTRDTKILSSFLKSKSVLIVHDVDYLRGIKNTKEEIAFFNNFSYVISHNSVMTKWMNKSGVTAKIVELEIFDYLADIKNINTNRNNNYHIAFPGNLDISKSGFVYKLKDMNLSKVYFNLYGPNFTGESTKFVDYKGTIHPEQLIETLTESFGLVWDGSEINDCTGDYGEYQRYNNPHKASLYIAAGLPIIISNKAALANFVREKNIGITIDSLEELETIIPNISDETYQGYIENLKDLQYKVTSGYFITTALNKVEAMIKNESH